MNISIKFEASESKGENFLKIDRWQNHGRKQRNASDIIVMASLTGTESNQSDQSIRIMELNLNIHKQNLIFRHPFI